MVKNSAFMGQSERVFGSINVIDGQLLNINIFLYQLTIEGKVILFKLLGWLLGIFLNIVCSPFDWKIKLSSFLWHD